MWLPTEFAKNYTLSHTDGQWFVDQPEYQWMFRHDGTRACTVAYARSPYLHDETYWANGRNPNTPWTQAKFDTVMLPLLFSDSVVQSGGTISDYGYHMEHYFFGPGIIEAVITIELTGTEPNDYEATVEIVEVTHPDQSTVSTIFCGYSYIDLPERNVVCGDMVEIHIEGFGDPSGREESQQFTSMVNVSKNTEIYCGLADPILAVDLMTCSLVVKVEYRELNHMRVTPQRIGSTAERNLGWLIYHFGVHYIHSGVSKGMDFPTTMTDDIKELLRARTAVVGRAQISEILERGFEYIPPAHPEDGWNGSFPTLRDWWAHERQYWYWFDWVLNDPDLGFYGYGYPDEGYVIYKTDSYTEPPGINDLLDRFFILAPGNTAIEPLFFCDNPRFGWNYYTAILKRYAHVGIFNTFFTHPNGSFAFYDLSLIYNAMGVPNIYAGSPTESAAKNANGVAIYDIGKLEHCIFDRIHLEVRNKNNVAGVRDTTFMAMYNEAVTQGRAEDTLTDETIQTITLADQKGVFELNVAPYELIDAWYGTTLTEVLDLKFSYCGVDWWYHDAACLGAVLGPMESPFPPMRSGGSVQLDTQLRWSTQAYTVAGLGGPLVQPGFPNMLDPAAASNAGPIKFCNALIVTG